MRDLIVSVPDHCLSFYFAIIETIEVPFECEIIVKGRSFDRINSNSTVWCIGGY